jgi:hypothetical protein
MITDRISLNLLYIYLKRVEANEGPIQEIIISHRSNREDTVERTLPRFDNLSSIWNFINTETSPGGFNNIHCMNLGLYRLKSFIIDKDKSAKVTEKSNFLVKSTVNDSFKTNGNLRKLTRRDLEIGYMPKFREVEKKWKEFILNEYIKEQVKYIDCGYIEVYFEDAIEDLKKLYNKYRENRSIVTKELYNKNIRRK